MAALEAAGAYGGGAGVEASGLPPAPARRRVMMRLRRRLVGVSGVVKTHNQFGGSEKSDKKSLQLTKCPPPLPSPLRGSVPAPPLLQVPKIIRPPTYYSLTAWLRTY